MLLYQKNDKQKTGKQNLRVESKRARKPDSFSKISIPAYVVRLQTTDYSSILTLKVKVAVSAPPKTSTVAPKAPIAVSVLIPVVAPTLVPGTTILTAISHCITEESRQF